MAPIESKLINLQRGIEEVSDERESGCRNPIPAERKGKRKSRLLLYIYIYCIYVMLLYPPRICIEEREKKTGADKEMCIGEKRFGSRTRNTKVYVI